ncbi:MAG TPA: FAD:protein FMN transferase [Vicinamibacteria bacterium]|nr:FAD:protein FMN transferase [Vicinamibacteria bacterium]
MKAEEPAPVHFGFGEAEGARQRFSHEAMATVFEVRCAHSDAAYARQAAQAAFDLVDRLEQEMSRFIANSDVSRVNGLGSGEAARVSPTTMECLGIARHLFDLTGGAFDVSIGSGLESLELDRETFTVHARRGGVRLDLGGIGKGYAVDRVAELLGEWEVGRAVVHGGFSSVVALEAPLGQDGWPLTLSEPAGGRVLVRLSARRRALSASGTRKGAHILDPRTGRPVPARAAWTSVPLGADPGASPAAVADGLSTAFMVLTEPEVADLCRDGPGLEAWLLREPLEREGGEPRLVHLGGPSA